MSAFQLDHVADEVLLRDLPNLVSADRVTVALILAHLGEVEARELFLPAGYPSMHAYCTGELHFSEETTNKRLRVARKAREFPALFEALRDGRLHSSAVILLSPHLEAGNVEELIALAAHKTRDDLEFALAGRFPPPGSLPLDFAGPAELSPGTSAGASPSETPATFGVEAGAGAGDESVDLSPGTSPEAAPPPPRYEPRVVLKVRVTAATREKLRYVRSLLSHAIPSGSIDAVFDRALDALIEKQEKRKYAATTAPRPARPSRKARVIPAAVKRAVWQRDRGQCTFIGPTGRRCSSRIFLEYDHILPVARGGMPTVENLHLRCRAHNQYEAERWFGRDYMRRKRAEARLRSESTVEDSPERDAWRTPPSIRSKAAQSTLYRV